MSAKVERHLGENGGGVGMKTVMPQSEPQPEGWQMSYLGDVTSAQQGGTPSKSHKEYWDGDIPFVTGADLTEFRIGRDNARYFLTEKDSDRVPPQFASQVQCCWQPEQR